MFAKTGSTIAEPPCIDFLALLAVDLGFHQFDQVRLAGFDL